MIVFFLVVVLSIVGMIVLGGGFGVVKVVVLIGKMFKYMVKVIKGVLKII